MKVAHIIKVLGRPNDSFFYRMVTNPHVENTIRCARYKNRDQFPHSPVSVTHKLSKTVSHIRRFAGDRIAGRIGNLLSARSWRRFIDNERPNIIHVQPGDLAVRHIDDLEKARIPLLVTFHGSDINCATFKNGYLPRLRRVFERAKQCHFVSNELCREAQTLGCPKARSIVEYLGTPIPCDGVRYSSRTADFRVAVAANLIPCKGHETLINAFRLVANELPRATLHIYGDGPLRDRLAWLVQHRSLEGNVLLHGNIPYRDLQCVLLGKTDVLALCSQQDDFGAREGLPMCLAEAAAAGLPLVGSRCGGIPEIVRDGQTGCLVEPRDATALARVLLNLGRNPELRQRLGQNARQMAVSEFDVKRQLARYAEIYELIIDHSKT